MDLTELKGEYSSLLVITAVENIQDIMKSVVSSLTKKNIPGVYLCFNKPYRTMKNFFKEKGVKTEKMFFIDCISSNVSETETKDNVLYMESPADLTGISIAITEFIEKIPGEKYLVLDALTTLLIYNRENLVIKFVKSLLAQGSKYGFKIFVVTPEPRGGDLINKISLLFDKIIRQ